MDLYNILDNKEEFYHLAIESYYNIEDDSENKSDEVKEIIPKSISILIDHEFIPTPCIEIKIQLYYVDKSKEPNSYYLYVSNEKEFIDEFFI